MNDAQPEVLAVNQRLLDCIAAGDWATYQELCHSSLTCFEPEARGHLVRGLEFHHYYFKLGGAKGLHTTTMSSPEVRIVGDVAVVAYVRLNQRQNEEGAPVTTAVEETRVWQRMGGAWKHVHFHRALIG